MGMKDFLKRRADEWATAKAEFEKGCEILGRPSDPTSASQRGERMRAGREAEAANHSGGWHEAQHGYIDNNAVTFALGWGTKEGEVLLADGHVSTTRPGPFWEGGHNHYGKGQGPTPTSRIEDSTLSRRLTSGPLLCYTAQ